MAYNYYYGDGRNMSQDYSNSRNQSQDYGNSRSLSKDYYSQQGYGHSSRNDPVPIFFPSQLNSNNNRQNMYKQGGGSNRYDGQEQRRQTLLLEQRSRREESHNRGRHFGEKKKKIAPPPPKPKEYKDVLTYSEYLMDRPNDLEDWIVVASPKGKRVTLVAHKGVTTIYDKAGKHLDNFPSLIPGGCDPANLHPSHGANRKSILDCIFVEHDQTFYVLDILMWNMHPFVDCETSLRFFWLENKLQEVDVSTKTRNNWHRIMPAIRFNITDLQQHVNEPFIYPNDSPRTDGFLFYHPEAIYTAGSTPLIAWLKGFMIPEIIPGIQVNPIYLKGRPEDYVNIKKYVEDSGNSYGHKKRKTKKHGHNKDEDYAMETY